VFAAVERLRRIAEERRLHATGDGDVLEDRQYGGAPATAWWCCCPAGRLRSRERCRYVLRSTRRSRDNPTCRSRGAAVPDDSHRPRSRRPCPDGDRASPPQSAYIRRPPMRIGSARRVQWRAYRQYQARCSPASTPESCCGPGTTTAEHRGQECVQCDLRRKAVTESGAASGKMPQTHVTRKGQPRATKQPSYSSRRALS
jgi:hypothetical protein